uniref:NYN domain-containing protein n=1 Tax=Aegilops tauschii subsp. strangulata TaxID=200361 RepID=A0A453K591_AEGTS
MSFEDKAMASRITSPSSKATVSESDLRIINVASNVDHSQANNQASAVLGPVAIFWDIENCPVPSDVRPDDVAGNIRMALRLHPVVNGAVTVLSAYGDFNAFPRRLREGCQRTGVKLVDVPNGRKDAADKAILVDMFLFALDNHPPSSIMLISGDVDFAPALHILGQRGYTIALAIPSSVTVSSALSSAGSFVWDWPSLARGAGSVPPRSLGHRAADPLVCPNSVTPGKFPDIQTEEEAIAYMGTFRNEYSGRTTSNQINCYNSSQVTRESCKAFCTLADGSCGTEYGAVKLVHLFEKLAESFVVIGKGQRKMICLRNSADRNMKKYPSTPIILKNEKRLNATLEEGTSETCQQLSSSSEDLSEDEQNINPDVDGAYVFDSHLYKCRTEVEALLVCYLSCPLPLSHFESLYEQRYKKTLDYQS